MRIIYVDDEKPAIDNFRLTVENFQEIEKLDTFQSGEEALEFVKTNLVDVAFLDMEMPGIHGIELARKLKARACEIRIIFVTAYGQFALDAFSVDAVGYVLKPYSSSDIHKELAKCTYRPLPSHRVVIETMPTLNITVDGAPICLSQGKSREMLAFLIDCGQRGFTVGECIAHLWPERTNDSGTLSLCRMTWKRLTQVMERTGVGDLIYTVGNRRYLKTESVSCDLYRILAGDKQALIKYNSEYLSEYEWSDERNAQLLKMQNS